ncbi:unnamed protein product [Effrenium voratum]|uniref:Fatty acid hydroxylase domain-containing protein n=1 Tax=Effrenium voratum TaxID=2562239 RepID=A0AA36JAB8_9DINO|nr:unnamed protein product [Effrenium voratum]
MTALAFLEINVALLRCFVSGLCTLRKLPHELWTSSEDAVITVSPEVRKEYEQKIQAIGALIREKSPAEYKRISTHTMLVLQRVLWIAVAAMSADIRLFWLAGSLQFLVAPYSLAVSFMLFIMFFYQMCASHLVSALVLHFLPLSWLPNLELEISNTSIAVFMALDFLVTSYYALVACSDGTPKRSSVGQSLRHMIYGTFNGRGYVLLLLLISRGCKISLTWIAADALLGISPWVNNFIQDSFLSWETMFYHIHRMEHLPVVYEHAHRIHHYLPDGTAWDSHIFSGAGFPEDFFYLLQDVLLVRYAGLPAPWMTYRLLKHQRLNKDAHQRRDASYQHEQYHPDHHLYHRVNFGFNKPMLDLLFDTYKPTKKEWLDLGEASYKKEQAADGSIVIHMKVQKQPFPLGSRQNYAGWQMALMKLMVMWLRTSREAGFQMYSASEAFGSTFGSRDVPSVELVTLWEALPGPAAVWEEAPILAIPSDETEVDDWYWEEATPEYPLDPLVAKSSDEPREEDEEAARRARALAKAQRYGCAVRFPLLGQAGWGAQNPVQRGADGRRCEAFQAEPEPRPRSKSSKGSKTEDQEVEAQARRVKQSRSAPILEKAEVRSLKLSRTSPLPCIDARQVDEFPGKASAGRYCHHRIPSKDSHKAIQFW